MALAIAYGAYLPGGVCGSLNAKTKLRYLRGEATSLGMTYGSQKQAIMRRLRFTGRKARRSSPRQ